MPAQYQLIPVRALKDNYIWLLRAGRQAAVVDPGDARPVLEYLEAESLQLAAILCTHHHADHVGGIAGLLAKFDVPVYGPKNEPIQRLSHGVSGGDRIEVPDIGASFTVLDIPGHTRAHIAYYGQNSLFCGDTLFACGCGRLFEGTAEQMYASLQKLAALPDDTLVYCGHEYTLANIDFAKAVEPANAQLNERQRDEAAVRSNGRPTLPSTIGREKSDQPLPPLHRTGRDRIGQQSILERAWPRLSRCLPRYATGKTASKALTCRVDSPARRGCFAALEAPAAPVGCRRASNCCSNGGIQG